MRAKTKLDTGVATTWMVLVAIAFPAWAVEEAPINNRLPDSFKEVGIDQKLGGALPLSVSVFNENGRKVRLSSYFDGERPVLLTLNYSDCPMLCSLQLNNLVTSLQDIELEIGDEFQVLTLSIDPRETPLKSRETKAKYVEVLKRDNAAEGWSFVTAEQQVITEVAESVGFNYEFVPETGQYSHAAMLAFCTPDGVISSYVLMIDYPPKQVKLGLIAASGGTIGSLVDNFVLYCSTYDVKEGSYTASAFKIMKLCGAMTVVMLLIGLVPYWLGRRGTGDVSATEEIHGKKLQDQQHAGVS